MYKLCILYTDEIHKYINSVVVNPCVLLLDVKRTPKCLSVTWHDRGSNK